MIDTSSSSSETEQLARNLERIYGIVIHAVVIRRTVYGLVGPKTSWIWKTAGNQDDEERFHELSGMTKYLTRNGLVCAGPLLSPSGTYITVPYAGAKPGYLQPWLPGRHVNAANPKERTFAVRSIARLHRFGSVLNARSYRGLQTGRLIARMKMKQRTLFDIWPVARQKAPILATVESYVWRTITDCISAYENWLSRYGSPVAFCHRDLAPHNLLWHEEGRSYGETSQYPVSFIDFDHAGFDDPIHDMLQFTSHSLFLSNCSAQDLQEMVDLYADETGLEKQRTQLLFRLLTWPDILIRTVVEWYRHGYERDKQIRIIHAVQKEELRRCLLQEITSENSFEALM